MSQSPYSPPPYGPGPVSYYGIPDPLAPARRSAILMGVIGVLALLLGGCLSAVGLALPSLGGQPEIAETIRQLEAQFHRPAGPVLTVFGVAFLCLALIYIVLAFFVYRGGFAAVMVAIVLTSLALIYCVINVAGVLFSAGGALGACFAMIPLAIHILLLVWLIQSARTASQVRLMQAQYQAQYWQYQQAQQSYGQSGYGYPASAAGDGRTEPGGAGTDAPLPPQS